jgi:hypothetical protein
MIQYEFLLQPLNIFILSHAAEHYTDIFPPPPSFQSLVAGNPYPSHRITFGPQNHCQRMEQDLPNTSLFHRFLCNGTKESTKKSGKSRLPSIRLLPEGRQRANAVAGTQLVNTNRGVSVLTKASSLDTVYTGINYHHSALS